MEELRRRYEQFRRQRIEETAKRNLYVKNLAEDVDDQKLLQEFQRFGPVTSAKVQMVDGKTCGFGFVCFSSPNDATQALHELNGKVFHAKPLYVAFAQRKQERKEQLAREYRARMLNRTRRRTTVSDVSVTGSSYYHQYQNAGK